MAVDVAPAGASRLLIKKSVDQVQREAAANGLKRSLGALNLTMLGIGSTIGPGIYVMTGNAAANFAGPAVMLSFVLAGLACAFAGLCYAELASAMPVAGSAYTYSYATLGEVFAWIMGWLLVLEYGIAASTVAVGFSGYVVSFLHDLHVTVPEQWSNSLVQSVDAPSGLIFSVGHSLNLIAALGILGVTGLLVLGISESASVNNVIVVIKVTVLLAFIAVGVFFIKPANWHPFIPANQGGFKYGVPGIFRAASNIFFAYVGFEAVSTAAAEAKNPQRDMPVGILGSLFVCTAIYIAVAAVLTGVVPFRQLGVPDPIAIGVDAMGMPWFAFLIKIGAVTGLFSVMLVLTYGQTRVFYTMARDGLLPRTFGVLHPKFRTPWIGTILLGLLIAVAATLLPITILGDLVNLGTASAFAIVCLSVMWLRSTRPDLARPFRVPLGGFWVGKAWIGYVPVGGILMCFVMVGPLMLDIVQKVSQGDPLPALILGCYALVGALIYIFYGMGHSKLARGIDSLADDPAPFEPPMRG